MITRPCLIKSRRFTLALSGTATTGIGGPAHCVLAVLFQKESPTDPNGPAGDVNISGVDFWHAVEFSRNGHFLRTAFQRTLRAFRSFVFPAYQMFSAPFSGVSFIRFSFAFRRSRTI